MQIILVKVKSCSHNQSHFYCRTILGKHSIAVNSKHKLIFGQILLNKMFATHTMSIQTTFGAEGHIRLLRLKDSGQGRIGTCEAKFKFVKLKLHTFV